MIMGLRDASASASKKTLFTKQLLTKGRTPPQIFPSKGKNSYLRCLEVVLDGEVVVSSSSGGGNGMILIPPVM